MLTGPWKSITKNEQGEPLRVVRSRVYQSSLAFEPDPAGNDGIPSTPHLEAAGEIEMTLTPSQLALLKMEMALT